MSMKSLLFSLPLFFSVQVLAQTDQPLWRLSGIINLPHLKKAVFQTEKEVVFLAEGEAVNWVASANKLELVKIDFTKETADVYTNKLPATLALNFQSQANHAETEATIIFERASCDAVLESYSDLLGRTLLRHPLLPETDFTFSARARNRDDAIRAIENALADKGIAFIPDGDVFALLVPKEIVSTLKMESFKSKTPTSTSPHDIEYHFKNVPLIQAAWIYAGLFGCDLKTDEQFPAEASTTLKLRTVGKVNKEEAIYALDTLFTWAGVKIVPAGQHLMKVVPVAQRE
jgi:hypothetical protein